MARESLYYPFTYQLIHTLMKCVAYCTASKYQIPKLFNSLQKRYTANLQYDVIHLDLTDETPNAHIFFFGYGATVFWGLRDEERQEFLKELKPYETSSLKSTEEDSFTVSFGTETKVMKDEIILASRDSLSLLAVSHALAQSVKLEAFERSLEWIFTITQHIPEDLARTGETSLSRKSIQKMIGTLMVERSSINVQCDVLDTPEFFWQNVDLEPIYMAIARYLAIEDRVEVLNKRLDIVHDLFEMLSNELKHQHSSRLEWTIIILIVLEVVLTLLRDVFHLI